MADRPDAAPVPVVALAAVLAADQSEGALAARPDADPVPVTVPAAVLARRVALPAKSHP